MSLWNPELSHALQEYSNISLKRMARFHDMDTSRKKAELVQDLTAHFTREGQLERAVAGLDERARTLLAFVHEADAWVKQDALVSALAPAGIEASPGTADTRWWRDSDDMGDPSAPDSRTMRDVLARLEVQGLLVGSGPRYGNGTVVDLGMAMDYAIPAEATGSLAPVDLSDWSRREEPDAWSAADSQPFGRALYALWSFVWRHEPPLLKKGTIAKRALKELATEYPLPLDVAAAASETDLPMVHHQRLLLEAMGVIENKGQRLRAAPGRARAHWKAPLAKRVRAWYAAWLELRGWNELDEIEGLGWNYYARPGHDLGQHVARARKRIVEFLVGQMRDGHWHDPAHLSALLELRDRDVLVPEDRSRTRYSWSQRSRYDSSGNRAGLYFGGSLGEAEGWQRVEARFMEQLLRTLHLFGLLDFAESDGRLQAVRLSALGRHLFADAPAPPEPSGGRFILQPNFHLLAFGPVPERDLLRLERFADRVSTDRAMELILNADSVYRAQRQGQSVDHILAELRALTESEVPQNVRRSLEEWQEAHEQIIVRRGVRLLQVGDPEVLAGLDDLPEAGTTLRRLSPTFALAEDVPALDALLERAELIPVQRHDPTARATVRLAQDGRVEPAHKFADLYTTGRLDTLAERDADAPAWRLTARAVHAAQSRTGLDADEQIAAWRKLCVDGGPPWLETRIKRWLGSYGKARLRRAWVLELDEPEALAALSKGFLDPADDAASDDAVAGDTVAGDTVAGDTVAGDTVAGDTVAGDAAPQERELGRTLRAYEPEGVPVLVEPEELAALRALLKHYGITLDEDAGLR